MAAAPTSPPKGLGGSPQNAIEQCRAILLDVLESAGNVGQDGEAEVVCLRPSWVRRKDREQLMSAMREMELKAKVAQRFAAFGRSIRMAKKEKAEASAAAEIHQVKRDSISGPPARPPPFPPPVEIKPKPDKPLPPACPANYKNNTAQPQIVPMVAGPMRPISPKRYDQGPSSPNATGFRPRSYSLNNRQSPLPGSCPAPPPGPGPSNIMPSANLTTGKVDQKQHTPSGLGESPQTAIKQCRAMLLEVLDSAGNVGQDGEAEVVCLRPSWVRRKDREQLISAMREMELKAKVAQRFAAFGRSIRKAKKEKAEASAAVEKRAVKRESISGPPATPPPIPLPVEIKPKPQKPSPPVRPAICKKDTAQMVPIVAGAMRPISPKGNDQGPPSSSNTAGFRQRAHSLNDHRSACPAPPPGLGPNHKMPSPNPAAGKVDQKQHTPKGLGESPQNAIEQCRAMLLEVLESAGNVGQDGEAEVLCLRPSWVRRKDREQLINAMREMELKAKGAQAFAAFRRSKREAKKEKAEAAVGTGTREVKRESISGPSTTTPPFPLPLEIKPKPETVVTSNLRQQDIKIASYEVAPPLISLKTEPGSPGSSPQENKPSPPVGNGQGPSNAAVFRQRTYSLSDPQSPCAGSSPVCPAPPDLDDLLGTYHKMPSPSPGVGEVDQKQHASIGLSESPKCLTVLLNSRRCLSDQGIDGLQHTDFMPPIVNTGGIRSPAAERAYHFAIESSKFERRVDDLRQRHQALAGILKTSQPHEAHACGHTECKGHKVNFSDLQSRCVRFATEPPSSRPEVSSTNPCGSDNDAAIVLADLARFAEHTSLDIDPQQQLHYAKTGIFLYNLFAHDQLVDTIIHVGSAHSFSAHACVLAAYSSFLAGLLLRPNITGNRYDVRLPECVTATAFKCVLDYMYTGEINLSSENAAEMLSASKALKIPRLQEKCRALMEEIDVNNVLLLWETAEEHGMTECAVKPLQMAAQNFLEVFKTHDFLLLTIERLCRLLSRDDLAITSELQVAEAGMVWAQHDLPNRKCHVSRILGCVRMCHMTPRELLDLACLDECVMNNLEAKQAILMTNWYLSCQQEGVLCRLKLPRSPIRTPPRVAIISPPCTPTAPPAPSPSPSPTSTPPPSPVPVPPAVVISPDPPPKIDATTSPLDLMQVVNDVTGGNDVTGFHPAGRSSFQSLSTNSSTLSMASCCSVPINIEDHPVIPGNDLTERISDFFLEDREGVHQAMGCAMGIRPPALLLVGGYDPADPGNDSACCLQTLESGATSWTLQDCCLPENRAHHTAVLLNGDLYVIGGCDTLVSPDQLYCASNTTYKLNFTTGEWRQLASMDTPRMHHCACVLDGKIFAIGGQDGQKNILSSVECYDPETNCWWYVSPTLEARFGASCLALDEEVLLVGGSGIVDVTDKSYMIYNSVERYCPVKDRWHMGAKMRIPRCYASIAMCRGRVFLCGGVTPSQTFAYPVCCSVNAMDEYDITRDTWRHVTDMEKPRHHTAAGVMGDRLYIAGGLSTLTNAALDTTECYNFAEDAWETVQGPTLSFPVLAPKCVLVE